MSALAPWTISATRIETTGSRTRGHAPGPAGTTSGSTFTPSGAVKRGRQPARVVPAGGALTSRMPRGQGDCGADRSGSDRSGADRGGPDTAASAHEFLELLRAERELEAGLPAPRETLRADRLRASIDTRIRRWLGDMTAPARRPTGTDISVKCPGPAGDESGSTFAPSWGAKRGSQPALVVPAGAAFPGRATDTTRATDATCDAEADHPPERCRPSCAPSDTFAGCSVERSRLCALRRCEAEESGDLLP